MAPDCLVARAADSLRNTHRAGICRMAKDSRNGEGIRHADRGDGISAQLQKLSESPLKPPVLLPWCRRELSEELFRLCRAVLIASEIRAEQSSGPVEFYV